MKRQIIVIADAGSTKTDWCLCDENKRINLSTNGINAITNETPYIETTLHEVFNVLEQMDAECYDKISIFYYGAGCVGNGICKIKALLEALFPENTQIEVYSDLYGAARALLANRQGIACILGTGANSCLYDGNDIIMNIPPLGYVLGDEGSGAVLGKMFINALFKHRLPSTLFDEFLRETSLTLEKILFNVYHQNCPNRFLASMSSFISRHVKSQPLLEDIIVDNFRNFLKNNVAKYDRPDLPVNAIGSIAFYYKEYLEKAAKKENLLIGTVEKSPMKGLIEFHSKLR